MNRFTPPALLVFCSLFSATLSAQQSDKKEEQQPQAQPILKLESTIRASREQPKVLSIVPWQPPGNSQTLPSPVINRINQQFHALNRAEFKRKLAHFEKLSQ